MELIESRWHINALGKNVIIGLGIKLAVDLYVPWNTLNSSIGPLGRVTLISKPGHIYLISIIFISSYCLHNICHLCRLQCVQLGRDRCKKTSENRSCLYRYFNKTAAQCHLYDISDFRFCSVSSVLNLCIGVINVIGTEHSRKKIMYIITGSICSAGIHETSGIVRVVSGVSSTARVVRKTTGQKWGLLNKYCHSCISLFSEIWIHYWISRSCLIGIATSYLWRHLSDMSVIQ